jgi:hypothetical protein
LIHRSKIRESARDQNCTIRVAGCTNVGVVLAHAPCVDKGLSIKSPNHWAAYACHHCHDQLDGRKGTLIMNSAPLWMRGIYETQKILITQGMITINE